MASYSLNKSKKTDKELMKLYEEAKKEMKYTSAELDKIFKVALLDRSLFASMQQPKAGLDEKSYLVRWIGRYKSAMENLPSKKSGTAKKSCSDPALVNIVKEVKGLSDAEAKEKEAVHNLFMAAENVQGGLLEEYISENVKSLGWIWCAGEVLRAVDFCNETGTALLQIKNKYNTENSSSSKIRTGTTIQKWCRIKKSTKKGKIMPSFQWDKLNEIIEKGRIPLKSAKKANMSEKDYMAFLKKVVTGNKNIITED